MTRLAAFRQQLFVKLGQSLKSERWGAVIFLSSCWVGASTLPTLKIRMELHSVKHFDADHVKEALAFAWMHQGTHMGSYSERTQLPSAMKLF